MSREIEFRAWSGCKMRNNVSINDGHCVRRGYQWFSAENDVYDAVPMQYTGLKDKNGTKIFEGDIVNEIFKGKYLHVDIAGKVPLKSLVKQDEANPCLVLHRINSSYEFDLEYDFVKCDLLVLEIIGNIYQDKDI